MGRAPCCEKVGLNRGPWTREEDMRLIQYIQAQGEGCWRTLPKAAGLLRCGKSCRLRWINYLRPDLKRGNISEEEDKLIIKLHSLLGNRWSLIARRLPGRTDNEIKNYWNTHLKKKLRNMGIDPQTHLPLLQDNASSNTTTKPSSKVICNPTSLDNKKEDSVFDNKASLSIYNKEVHSLSHQFSTSLITSTSDPNINLISPTNKLMNKSVLSFKAKPLDQNTSRMHDFKYGPPTTKTLHSSSHLDPFNLFHPPLTSLVAIENSAIHTNSLISTPSSSILATIFSNKDYHPTNINPLVCPPLSTCMLDHLVITNNVLNGSTLVSSSSSSSSAYSSPSSSSSSSSSSLLSLYALRSPSMQHNTTSPPMECFSSILEEVYPSTNENSTKNESLLSHINSLPLSSSSSLASSSMLLALSPSASLSIDASYGYHNKSTYEATLSCYHNKGTYESTNNAELIGLTTNDIVKRDPQELEGIIDEGEDILDGGYDESDNEYYDKHEKMLKECGLRLMEGEFMWDMEMMHSIQEVGTPTRGSSMLASPSYNLWGHDFAY